MIYCAEDYSSQQFLIELLELKELSTLLLIGVDLLFVTLQLEISVEESVMKFAKLYNTWD